MVDDDYGKGELSTDSVSGVKLGSDECGYHDGSRNNLYRMLDLNEDSRRWTWKDGGIGKLMGS